MVVVVIIISDSSTRSWDRGALRSGRTGFRPPATGKQYRLEVPDTAGKTQLSCPS